MDMARATATTERETTATEMGRARTSESDRALAVAKRLPVSGAAFLRAAVVLVMLAVPLAAPRIAPLKQINDNLIAERFHWAPRQASGKIVFIAIDKRSLDAVGIWPWPRSIYAKLLDNLTAARAADIFLDIDFSTPSVGNEDQALALALSNTGGVLLPVFRQQLAAGSAQTTISEPIPEFLRAAWPVLANVSLDADGSVRRFDLGGRLDSGPTSSGAVALAGRSETSGTLPIDYSITPESIPSYSLSDVLTGRVAAAQLEGRAVIVGASAAELKDFFSVPVYGTLPGPLIHLLAAETLLQNRILTYTDAMPLELLLAAVLIVGVFTTRFISMIVVTGFAAIVLVSTEIVAFRLQADVGMLVGTVECWVLFGLAWVLALNERVDLSRMLALLANNESRHTRRLMRSIIAGSSDGIIAFDSALEVLEINQSANSSLGIEKHAFLPDSLDPVIAAALGDLLLRRDKEPDRVLSAGVEYRRQTSDGDAFFEASITISPIEPPHTMSAPSFAGCVIIRDITTRKRHEDTLKRLAERDELTGLLNRREFLARLTGADGIIAIIDVERFSTICATLGRDVGDALLKAVASRLAPSFREAPLARIDGDLFAVFLAGTETPAAQVECVLGLFEEAMVLGALSLTVAVRLGLARSIADDPVAALHAAESALHATKQAAGRWSEFDPATALLQLRSRRLEIEMRDALRKRQFFLLFQSQVDLGSGEFVGAEALLRWQHPELGAISPTEFIPIAESSGLICEIGRWVLMEACVEAARWPTGIISVNVSSIQFERSDMATEIEAALAMSRLPASRLCVELTESAFIGDGGRSRTTMAAIRQTGVQIALDDFGTGYSSMRYLADLPLDKLKIDQSFVRRMTGEAGVLEIVKAIMSMAHGLGLDIVAEGIEGKNELDVLCQLGCGTGQGYFFAKPQFSDQMLRQYGLSFASQASA
jgi:diguanylate cyclase (GGDEF)-like protein